MTTCIDESRYHDRNGYGLVFVDGKLRRAHRVAWEKAHGPIPKGALVCHHCDNPSCTNAEHLFLGSHADNHRDRGMKGRTARGSRQGSAKLTEEMAVYAMARLLAGEAQRAVAASFGVSHGTIAKLWQGRSWAHLFAGRPLDN